MKKYGKKYILLILIFLILTAGALAFYLYTRQKKGEISIAAILPLTGDASEHSTMANALNLAIDEINFTGGINGKKIKLYVADSQTDPEVAKKAFIDIEKKIMPLFYISSASIVSLGLGELAEKNHVVLMGIVVSDPGFTKNKKWVFRYFTTPSEEIGPVMEIVKKVDINTIGVLYQQDSFGKAHQELIAKLSEEEGISTYSYPFPSSTKDFSPFVEQVHLYDAIYVVGFVNGTEKAINKINEYNYKGYIFSHSGTAGAFKRLTGLNNLYVAAPIIYNPNYQYAAGLQKRYEKEYQDSFTQRIAIAYDLIKLVSGILEGQKVSREIVRDILESEFTYPGIFGFIEKQQGVHDITFPLFPAKIANGKLEYLME